MKMSRRERVTNMPNKQPTDRVCGCVLEAKINKNKFDYASEKERKERELHPLTRREKERSGTLFCTRSLRMNARDTYVNWCVCESKAAVALK